MMNQKEHGFSDLYTIQQNEDNELLMTFLSNVDVKNASLILKHLQTESRLTSGKNLIVDLVSTSRFDDYGVMVLLKLKQMITNLNGRFRLINANDRVDKILRLTGFDAPSVPVIKSKQKKINFIIRSGEAMISLLYDIRYFVSFLGSVILAFLHVLRHPKALRLEDTIDCMEKTGVNALPIVAMISFLLGLVMAFMSSLQLQQFGANIYVASLVAIAMVSELGPIMTAIIVAGRSGSAFAAEIGTMKISEEIDALFVMGFPPTLFLVVPRLVASLIVVPVLTLFSNLFAITGGLLVGVFLLDLTMSSYIAQTIKGLTLFEVFWGMSKSCVFAFLIAWIGCLRGFQTRGGADSVGNAATSAVVSSIFLIILFDSIFAVTRSFWG